MSDTRRSFLCGSCNTLVFVPANVLALDPCQCGALDWRKSPASKLEHADPRDARIRDLTAELERVRRERDAARAGLRELTFRVLTRMPLDPAILPETAAAHDLLRTYEAEASFGGQLTPASERLRAALIAKIGHMESDRISAEAELTALRRDQQQDDGREDPQGGEG